MLSDKISLLESVLGGSIPAHRDNVSFHCPFCNHPKPKLNVALDTGAWGCWVCGDENDSKGRTVISLFRKLNTDRSKILAAAELWKIRSQVNTKKESISLPSEYIPLWIPNPKSLFYNRARRYVKSRGITDLDMIKYKLGYCITGRYADMIIMPSYDENNRLNYYAGRSYLSDPKIKFLVPNEIDKNIVCFESTINWSDPIILVESQINAITIRRNAIPLNGKSIPGILKEKIINSECPKIILFLDGDALLTTMRHASYFIQNGIDVYVVDVPEDEDANSLGFVKSWELIDNARKVDERDLFSFKVMNRLKGQ